MKALQQWFSVAPRVLQDHFRDAVIAEPLLWPWTTGTALSMSCRSELGSGCGRSTCSHCSPSQFNPILLGTEAHKAGVSVLCASVSWRSTQGWTRNGCRGWVSLPQLLSDLALPELSSAVLPGSGDTGEFTNMLTGNMVNLCLCLKKSVFIIASLVPILATYRYSVCTGIVTTSPIETRSVQIFRRFLRRTKMAAPGEKYSGNKQG